MVHYDKIGNLTINKSDCDENRKMRKHTSDLRKKTHIVPLLTIKELTSAIGNMKAKGAAHPDDIFSPLNKHPGPKARDLLLEIINASLKTVTFPQIRRNASIIPLLKAGKAPRSLARLGQSA